MSPLYQSIRRYSFLTILLLVFSFAGISFLLIWQEAGIAESRERNAAFHVPTMLHTAKIGTQLAILESQLETDISHFQSHGEDEPHGHLTTQALQNSLYIVGEELSAIIALQAAFGGAKYEATHERVRAAYRSLRPVIETPPAPQPVTVRIEPLINRQAGLRDLGLAVQQLERLHLTSHDQVNRQLDAQIWRRNAVVFPAAVALLLCALIALRYLTSQSGTALLRLEQTDRWLRDSERQFRDYAEAASDWFWEMDANLRFTWFSDRYAEVGLEGDERIGKTRWETTADTDTATPEWRAHKADLQARRPFKNFVHRGKKRDGSVVIMSVSGTPVYDEAGSFKGYRGSATDITERIRTQEKARTSESWFRATIDQIPSAVSLKHPDGRYFLVNQTFQDWFNPKSLETRDKTALDFVPDSHAREVMAMEASVRKSKAPLTRELEIPTRDSTKKMAFVHKFPLLDSAGEISAIGTIETDSTELRAAEAQLRQAQKMEAVGQLTGGVAHDFNNALAIIQGNLELARNRLPPGDDCVRWLDAAIAASKRGATLTQRLLAFARKQALHPQPTAVGQLVQGMRDLLRGTLGEPVDVRVVLEPELWAVEIDPAQLENAILNLAINARDAMDGQGKLTIEASNVQLSDEDAMAQAPLKPGDYVLIAVSDTGCGMAPEILEHVFEPFFTTKDVDKGTGLGLSMIYGFVKQSGGHITIYSELGEGTTARIYLPRHQGTPETQKSRSEPEKVEQARGEVILIVEDNPELLMSLLDMLQSLDYSVLTATSAGDALQVLESSSPVHLLLSDIVLPGGVGGTQLGRQVRERFPELPILYMSGYSENAMAHRGNCEAEGHFLQKPFRLAELAREVRRALERSGPKARSAPTSQDSQISDNLLK